MRIVHATESLGGGVLSVLELLAASQIREGAVVEILFLRRPDTPALGELEDRFQGALVTEVAAPAAGIKRLMALRQALRDRLRRGDVVIHLHSSFAGAVGRMVSWRDLSRACVVYSPHGVSYVRRDVSRMSRRTFFLIERLLASAPVSLVGVGDAERDQLRRLKPRRPVDILMNRIALDSLPTSEEKEPGFRIINMGRVVPQKGYRRFAATAAAMPDADFHWVGDGEGREVLEAAGVQVSGWLGRAETLERLSRSHVMLFTSDWEGLPMALVEAQALGIPVVAWDCVGASDVVVHGVSGYVVDAPEKIVAALDELRSEPERWRSYSRAATINAARFGADTYGRDSLDVYQRAAARQRRSA